MSMEPIIEIRGLGKRYRITRQRGGYIALRDVLMNVIKSPLRFLVHKAKVAVGLDKREEYWALRNIDVSIQKGEIIGVIGANGAGKSTLLKILTGITPPTEGEVVMRGRVASLLEVGTGFHPELSGRENIFLNGAILGMKKEEIVRKFDEIVTFAGIERFLDTPVKYYSSGMYVRLAFSVAAHMEPDILLVDEVLAVGDAEFQKKCLGKMEEVTRVSERTILFVSHNMGALQNICTKTIWLERGKLKAFGDTHDIIQRYLQEADQPQAVLDQACTNQNEEKDIFFTDMWVTDQDGRKVGSVPVDQTFSVWLDFVVRRSIDTADISLCFKNTSSVNVTFASLSDSFGQKLANLLPGAYRVSASFRGNFLMPDHYFIRVSAHERGVRDIDLRENALHLTVIENGSPMANYGPAAIHWAVVLAEADWKLRNQSESA